MFTPQEEPCNTLNDDFKALKDATCYLNDLICAVSYGGTLPDVRVVYDGYGRPQVQVALDDLEDE